MLKINGKTVTLEGGALTCGDSHGVGEPTVRVNGVAVALVGQLSAGHGGFPPTPALEGDPTDRINGIPIVVSGSQYAPHTDGESVHIPTAI